MKITDLLGLDLKSFLIVSLLIILFIGTTNKININFSKKENKRILYAVVLILCYFYFENIKQIYIELKKDIINPGSGKVGTIFTNVKEEIKSLDSGYGSELKQNILNLDRSNDENLNKQYEMSEIFKDELKRERGIALIETVDNKLYLLKNNSSYENKNKEYLLESKINTNDMLKTQIKIDKYSPEYTNIFSLIKNITNLDENNNIYDILIKPEKPILNVEFEDKCGGCYVQQLTEYNAQSYINESLNKCVKLPVEEKLLEIVDENGENNMKNTKVQNYNCCVSCPDDCFPKLSEYNKNYSEFTQDEIKDILVSQNSCQNI